MERDPKKPEPVEQEGGRAAARLRQLEQQRGIPGKMPAEKSPEAKPKPEEPKE